MRIPENYIIPSHFMGNYFCLIDKYEVAFVAIAKNGVTFLKKLAVHSKTGQIPITEDDAHNTIGFTDKSEYLIPVSQMKNYEKKNKQLFKFAVWRDPVERLISTYKFFCLEREFRNYFKYLDLYNDNSFERFMEFVEFELKKSNPEYQDEHIRRQVDYYKEQEVDYIVPINKLNQFLTEKEIPLIGDKANETNVKFKLTDKKWINIIKEMYKEDYTIKVNY